MTDTINITRRNLEAMLELSRELCTDYERILQGHAEFSNYGQTENSAVADAIMRIKNLRMVITILERELNVQPAGDAAAKSPQPASGG